MKPPRILKKLDFIDFLRVASIKAVQHNEGIQKDAFFRWLRGWDLNLFIFEL